MDILSLISTFCDEKAKSECTLLYLDGIKAHGSFGGKAVNPVIKYLKRNLSSKNRYTALIVLKQFIKYCSRKTLNDYLITWIKILENELKHRERDSKCEELVWEILTDLVLITEQNSETNFLFKNEVLPMLLPLFFKNGMTYDLPKLRFLKCVINQYPKNCRKFSNEIEELVFKKKMLGNEDIIIQKEAAKCFARLCQFKNAESDTTLANAWEQHFKKILQRLNGILSILFERFDNTENQKSLGKREKNELKDTHEFKVDGSIDQIQKLRNRFHLLCFCASEMLRVPFPESVRFPIEDVLDMIMHVLSVTSNSFKSEIVTDDMMLFLILPLLHEDAFKLLSCVIETCRRNLIPYKKTICKLFKLGLEWTGQCDKTTNKPFCELRCQIYMTIKIWAEVAFSASGLDKYCEEFCNNLTYDLAVPTSTKIQQLCCINTKKGKKRKASEMTRNERKTPVASRYNQLQNENLTHCALKAFNAMHYAAGEMTNRAVYANMCSYLIRLALEVLTCEKKPQPYESPRCRQELYSSILAITLVYPPGVGSPLQIALKILTYGLQDVNKEVVATCIQARAACMPIIHPRLPTLNLHFEVCDKEKTEDLVMKFSRNLSDREMVTNETDDSHDLRSIILDESYQLRPKRRCDDSVEDVVNKDLEIMLNNNIQLSSVSKKIPERNSTLIKRCTTPDITNIAEKMCRKPEEIHITEKIYGTSKVNETAEKMCGTSQLLTAEKLSGTPLSTRNEGTMCNPSDLFKNVGKACSTANFEKTIEFKKEKFAVTPKEIANTFPKQEIINLDESENDDDILVMIPAKKIKASPKDLLAVPATAIHSSDSVEILKEQCQTTTLPNDVADKEYSIETSSKEPIEDFITDSSDEQRKKINDDEVNLTVEEMLQDFVG